MLPAVYTNNVVYDMPYLSVLTVITLASIKNAKKAAAVKDT